MIVDNSSEPLLFSNLKKTLSSFTEESFDNTSLQLLYNAFFEYEEAHQVKSLFSFFYQFNEFVSRFKHYLDLENFFFNSNYKDQFINSSLYEEKLAFRPEFEDIKKLIQTFTKYILNLVENLVVKLSEQCQITINPTLQNTELAYRNNCLILEINSPFIKRTKEHPCTEKALANLESDLTFNWHISSTSEKRSLFAKHDFYTFERNLGCIESTEKKSNC